MQTPKKRQEQMQEQGQCQTYIGLHIDTDRDRYTDMGRKTEASVSRQTVTETARNVTIMTSESMDVLRACIHDDPRMVIIHGPC